MRAVTVTSETGSILAAGRFTERSPVLAPCGTPGTGERRTGVGAGCSARLSHRVALVGGLARDPEQVAESLPRRTVAVGRADGVPECFLDSGS